MCVCVGVWVWGGVMKIIIAVTEAHVVRWGLAGSAVFLMCARLENRMRTLRLPIAMGPHSTFCNRHSRYQGSTAVRVATFHLGVWALHPLLWRVTRCFSFSRAFITRCINLSQSSEEVRQNEDISRTTQVEAASLLIVLRYRPGVAGG